MQLHLSLFPVSVVTSTFWTGIGLLAEGGAPAGDGVGGSLTQILTLVVPIGILFYFLMIRPQRRERAQRQSMIDDLKKNDRIVTIGGIYGVVTNVRREDDEITIKVDETSNAKLRITYGAIARVISEESSSEK